MENRNTVCEQLINLALNIRRRIIDMGYNAKVQGTHFGGALSIVDVLSVLYGYIMRFDPHNPMDNNRDRLILSKGHVSVALYATLNLIDCITDIEIESNFLRNGGFLPEHPVKNLDRGIECSTGSLGMGLSFAVGKALAAKLDSRNYRVFVILGDGECNEGGCWEAMMAARQYKLDNLIMVIDKNNLQLDGYAKDIIDVDLASGVAAMGWKVVEVDGHNIEEIVTVLQELVSMADNIPKAIVAHTIKGKGVSFMENNNVWHHGRLSDEQYAIIQKEFRTYKNGN
jgi:transketolase